MADVADKERDKLIFVPSKSVTFMPNCSKQMAEMTITNESDKTYMFKMKSTRPGMFKMRPVYGAVQPTEKCTVKLIFKGLKPGQEAPRRERFTVVTAVAPSATVNTEKVWKMQKYQEKLCEGDVQKRKFRILFFGINDQEEEEEENKAEKKVDGERIKSGEKADQKKKDDEKGGRDREIIHEKEKIIERQMIIAGGSREKDKEKTALKEKSTTEKIMDKTAVEQPTQAVDKSKEKVKETTASKDKEIVKEKEIITNVVVKKEYVQAPQRKLVVMMYRDRKEEDSLSGDDDNDDISTLQPLPQPAPKPAAQAPPKPPAPQAKPPPPPAAPAPTKKPGPITAKPNPKGLTVAQKKQLEKADQMLGGANAARPVQSQKTPAKVK